MVANEKERPEDAARRFARENIELQRALTEAREQRDAFREDVHRIGEKLVEAERRAEHAETWAASARDALTEAGVPMVGEDGHALTGQERVGLLRADAGRAHD